MAKRSGADRRPRMASLINAVSDTVFCQGRFVASLQRQFHNGGAGEPLFQARLGGPGVVEHTAVNDTSAKTDGQAVSDTAGLDRHDLLDHRLFDGARRIRVALTFPWRKGAR